MSKIALIKCVKMQKIALIDQTMGFSSDDGFISKKINEN
jgi:hypothetical protein